LKRMEEAEPRKMRNTRNRNGAVFDRKSAKGAKLQGAWIWNHRSRRFPQIRNAE
jgi:hypothetical protein